MAIQNRSSAFNFRITDIDMKAIGTRLNMTQEEFAARFGFSINTLRHWEQGRRVPEGPIRAYLLVIDRDPKAVQKALAWPPSVASRALLELRPRQNCKHECANPNGRRHPAVFSTS